MYLGTLVFGVCFPPPSNATMSATEKKVTHALFKVRAICQPLEKNRFWSRSQHEAVAYANWVEVPLKPDTDLAVVIMQQISHVYKNLPEDELRKCTVGVEETRLYSR